MAQMGILATDGEWLPHANVQQRDRGYMGFIALCHSRHKGASDEKYDDAIADARDRTRRVLGRRQDDDR
jgi:hypothetical protein